MLYSAQAVLRVQAQAHYPLVDVFAVSSYLDELAAECKARMATSDANTDLEKLAVLNQLMFNPPADGRYAAHKHCHAFAAGSCTLALQTPWYQIWCQITAAIAVLSTNNQHQSIRMVLVGFPHVATVVGVQGPFGVPGWLGFLVKWTIACTGCCDGLHMHLYSVLVWL